MPDWFLSILVPALTGLSFLAYRHPNAYAKMFPGFMVAYLAGSMGVIVWNVSSTVTFHVMDRFIPFDEFSKASDAVGAVTIGFWPSTIVGLIFIYLLFLSYLPKILGKKLRLFLWAVPPIDSQTRANRSESESRG